MDTKPGGDKLTRRNLWSYSLGSIGRDMSEVLWSSYLMTFVIFTKTLTSGQFAAISMIVVVVRVFDALNDPIMGNILEITRTKWGKFKPWITAGMLFSAVVFYLSFSSKLNGWNYVAFFGVMYVLFDLGFTMNDIAYWGMLPSLSSAKGDRDLLTSRTVLLSGIGGGITTIIVPALTAGDYAIGGNALAAYSRITMIFCAFFIGMQLITLFGVKENPLPAKSGADSVSLKIIWGTIRNNDQLVWCILIFFLNSIGGGLINGQMGTSYIYFEFGYNGVLFTVFSVLGAGAAGLVMLFFAPISKRFSRMWLMKAAAVCSVGGYVFILITGLLVPGGQFILKFSLLMFGNLFAFAGQNVCFLVLMICIANTVEYNDWKTGNRAEGIIFSLRPLITKLGYSAVQFIAMFVFILTGVRNFTNRIAEVENMAEMGSVTDEVKAEMIKDIISGVPGSKSAALLACMTVIPAILAYVTYYFYKKYYTIDEENYERMVEEIEGRKNS
ncbi:MAG: MFS transporter [Oscillospiraceae bacterium]|nr:MFS transporter [Oscillospiraceae bacterium]